MPVVSSAGAAAAAASAAIAANNARIIHHGSLGNHSIWANAFMASFFSIILSLLLWTMIKYGREDGFPWSIMVGIYMTFGALVLSSFTLPAVFVMWLCGLLS